MKTRLGQDSAFSVAAFASPAVLLMLVFVVLPMLLAAGATLTNHRLMSPEPTRFIGLDNYVRLLSLKLAVIEPQQGFGGAALRDEEGVRFPTWRQVRQQRPQLEGYRVAFGVDLGESRVVLAATDPLIIGRPWATSSRSMPASAGKT